jgi:hypothetical protein
MSDLLGCPAEHDMHWNIWTGEFVAGITEYNSELTGYDKRLADLHPNIFHYGGNAHYIKFTFVPKMGWGIWRANP